MKRICLLSLLFFAAPCLAADLSGNWAVRDPLPDGADRTTYLNLKQDGSHITGTIRVTQFLYKIVGSSGGPDTFTLTASMMDGHTERRVNYEVKLTGDDSTSQRTAARIINSSKWSLTAPQPVRAHTPLASSHPRSTEFPTMASPKLLPWAGTVGTNSPAASMTPPCAAWPTPWSPAA